MKCFATCSLIPQQLTASADLTVLLERLGRMQAAGVYLMVPEAEALEAADVLRGVLRRANDQGLEIHLGLIPFSKPPLMTMDMERRCYRYAAAGQVYTQGLCPAWPENRLLALNRARRFMEVFEPEALHLDYLRFVFASNQSFGEDLEWENGRKWIDTYHRCLCPLCESERLELLGREATSWDEQHPGYQYRIVAHRHEAITSFLRQLQELRYQSKIQLSITARVQYLNRALIEGQDWISWARQGLVDVVSPLNFSTSAAVVASRLQENQRLLGHTNVTVLEGLGRKSSAGEPTPEEFAKQVQVVAEAGLAGVVICRLDHLSDRDLDMLAEYAD